MGFVARKSFKVMPGVRMTVSKSGLSASAGVPGARISKSSSGRTTRTVGIPGTGVYHTKSTSSGQSKSGNQSRAASPPPAAAPRSTKPGFTAPKWEKVLYKAVTTSNFGELPTIAQAYPEAAPVAATLDGLVTMQSGQRERALEVCRWAWATVGEIEDHPFVRKYISGSQVTIGVAEGVSATLQSAAMPWASLSPSSSNQPATSMPPSRSWSNSTPRQSQLSPCPSYTARQASMRRLSISPRLRNEDDPTALLLAFRGVALRELGHHTAAREAFKEALKSKSRDAAIRHFALVGRAKTYMLEKKPSMARKDLDGSLPRMPTTQAFRNSWPLSKRLGDARLGCQREHRSATLYVLAQRSRRSACLAGNAVLVAVQARVVALSDPVRVGAVVEVPHRDTTGVVVGVLLADPVLPLGVQGGAVAVDAACVGRRGGDHESRGRNSDAAGGESDALERTHEGPLVIYERRNDLVGTMITTC